MKRAEIRAESLQITVYDYDRIGSGEYVGEVRQFVYMFTMIYMIILSSRPRRSAVATNACSVTRSLKLSNVEPG